MLLGLLALWATTSFHGYPAALVAWIGIVIFLLTRIQSWDDVVGNTGAWDIMLWLGGLLALATALREEGVIKLFAERVGCERGPPLRPGRRRRRSASSTSSRCTRSRCSPLTSPPSPERSS